MTYPICSPFLLCAVQFRAVPPKGPYKHGAQSEHQQLGELSVEEIQNSGFQIIIDAAEDWSRINPFALQRQFGSHALTLAALALISSQPSLHGLGIDYFRLTRFLRWANKLYTLAPYHNTKHALHVLLATHCLLKVRRPVKLFSKLN